MTQLYLLGLIVVIILVVASGFPVGGGGMLPFAVFIAIMKTAVIRKKNQRPLDIRTIVTKLASPQCGEENWNGLSEMSTVQSRLLFS